MKLRSISPSAIAGITVLVAAGIGAANVFLGSSLPAVSIGIERFASLKNGQVVKYPTEEWSLLAAGDVMLSRYVATVMNKETVHYPYDHIRDIVASADVAFANLENPVGPGAPMPEEGLRFRANPEALDGMRNAGFDIVSLANNHQSDIGQAAIGATVEYIRNAGITPVGAGANKAQAHTPVVMNIKGTNVAFLAYGDARFKNQVHFATESKPGIALADPVQMTEDITLAKQQAEMVVVSIHAGAEYRETPDTVQREIVQAAVDAGAHIVLGHHPHVVQPLEQLGETWVIYSMGNLIFDQDWSAETKRGMMMNFRMQGSDVREIEAIPVSISSRAQPSIALGTEADAATNRLQHPMSTATVIQWDGPDSAAIISERSMPLQQVQQTAFTIEKTLNDNINGNRSGETFALSKGRLTASEDGFSFWQSPDMWWVQDFHLADINGDHQKELIVSAWKESAASFRHQVLVYTIRGSVVSQLVQSNAEGPACEIAAADLDGDGESEIITLNGDYTKDATCSAHTVRIWNWNGSRLEEEWASAPGSYWNIRTELGGKAQIVIVDGVEG